MNFSKYLLFFLSFIILSVSSSLAGMSTQLGFGYGEEWRRNLDLMQYELFWRQPLSYKTTIGDNWDVSTAIELGAALITEAGSDNDRTARFSLMPQVILSPHDMINFIFGVGTGFMIGETEFTDHDLGGSFLLNAKVAVQLLLGEHWGFEYAYYHQSNGNIYAHNASLNMHQIAFAYNF